MAEYFNAKTVLPAELIMRVLEHIPHQSKSGAIVYFSEDYYAKRNGEIGCRFKKYRSDPAFGSHLQIYEALSEQYGLTVRQICKIVREVRQQGDGPLRPRRRYSGVRVGRSSRRMSVRTVVP
jgi:hypothetical protein